MRLHVSKSLPASTEAPPLMLVSSYLVGSPTAWAALSWNSTPFIRINEAISHVCSSAGCIKTCEICLWTGLARPPIMSALPEIASMKTWTPRSTFLDITMLECMAATRSAQPPTRKPARGNALKSSDPTPV